MANLERMTVVVLEPMAARLRAAVEAGDYASTSEAVHDAVRLWSEQRQMLESERERLRQAWDTGKASGLHGQLGFDDLRRDAQARLRAVKVDAG